MFSVGGAHALDEDNKDDAERHNDNQIDDRSQSYDVKYSEEQKQKNQPYRHIDNVGAFYPFKLDRSIDPFIDFVDGRQGL